MWWSMKSVFISYISRLNLPRGSTEFYHRREPIPIDAKDLCDIHKISQGEFGHVFSVVSKNSAAIPIAVKVCNLVNTYLLTKNYFTAYFT